MTDIHGVVVGLFEDDVLQHGDGIDVLLLDRAVIHLLLTDHDTSGLGLEEDTTGGDGLRATVLELGDADRAEAYLEDADAIELDLLTHLEEVLEGFAQFLEHGLDVALLDGGLSLDELSEFLGTDKVVVVDSRGEVLALSLAVAVLVLGFNKFLRHNN